MAKKLVLATSNLGKLKEFQALFEEYGLSDKYDLISLKDNSRFVPPVEDAQSFVGNALIKAYAAAEATGEAALADDSGICVDFLNGGPAIYSARFASLNSFKNDSLTKDQLNYSCLLDIMKNVPKEKRKAHFFCCLVLVRHPLDPTPLIAFGSCNGEILTEPHGNCGHGYDPVFYSYDLGKTFGEASLSEKNEVSHRTRSFKHLLKKLGRKEFLLEEK